MIPFPNISPELFSITLFGMEFALRWYALAYIAGIAVAWAMAVYTLRRAALWPNKTAPFQPSQVEDLMTWVIVGIILGGRLGFVFFYQPGYYLSHPWEIPMIWQGGMAFHGGLLGVVLAGWLWAIRNAVPKLQLADLMALCTPPGLLLGRLANFINAELWGRPTDLPWGVVFPGDRAQECGPLIDICARHPSQLYEAVLEGLVLGMVLVVLAWRRGWLKNPGRIAALFFAGYGLARFFVEFVRQPDAQFISPGNSLGLAWHVNGIGLTMGQILSLPMIIIGVWMVVRLRARPATTGA